LRNSRQRLPGQFDKASQEAVKSGFPQSKISIVWGRLSGKTEIQKRVADRHGACAAIMQSRQAGRSGAAAASASKDEIRNLLKILF
jgi:hypothetical protein